MRANSSTIDAAETPAKAEKALSKRRESAKASEPPVDLLKGTVGYAINRAEMRCYQALCRRLAADMSPARLTALSMIGSNPGVNQTELGVMLKISSPSVVKVVNALEASGYVIRTAVDRRSYALTLTEAGVKELARSRKIIDECEEETVGQLSAAERATLISLLQRVAPEKE